MNIEQESTNIQEHLDKGNYHAAINLAISAHNASRREQNQQAVNHFLNLIQSIVDTLKKEFSL